jgi:WD40 repeat protein
MRTIDAGLGDVYYAFSLDSGLLAAIGTVPPADPEAIVADTPCLRVWLLATGKKVLERTWADFRQIDGPFHFTRDGKSLIVLNLRSGLITWLDPKTGDRQRRVRVPTSERTGAFSPDDSTYAFVDSKGKLRVYDAKTWKSLQVLEVPG